MKNSKKLPKIVNQHRKQIKHLIFVGILSVIPRIPCLFGGFVFDDRPAILDNQDVVKNNFDSIWNTIFLHDFWGGNLTAKSSHKSYRFVVLLFVKQNTLGFSHCTAGSSLFLSRFSLLTFLRFLGPFFIFSEIFNCGVL